jgi:hypothetical protein
MKDRERKKIALAKSQLNSVEDQLVVSTEWKPVYEHVLNTIKSLASAYNTESGQKVLVNFSTLPPNLYTTKGEMKKVGTVTFPNKIVWQILLRSSEPPQRDSPPMLYVTFLLNEKDNGLSYCAIVPQPKRNQYQIVLFGPNVPKIGNIEQLYPINSYRDS